MIDVFKNSDDSWDGHIKNVLGLYDMNSFYENVDRRRLHPFMYKKLFVKMSDKYNDESLKSIKKESSKLRTYALFKTEVGLEPYLIDIKNFDMRSKVTKFRLSNHKLSIETGRYDKVSKYERFCPFCPSEVEDEAHFLIKCHGLRYLREKYLESLMESIDGFETPPLNRKIKTLMCKLDFSTYTNLYQRAQT